MNESQISRQHPIPQNFMDVEFKIVGEFTVRQFTYLCVTGFPMYLIFNSPIQTFIKAIFLIILGLLGILLVFVPIDDRSMDVWIVNFFRSVYANNRKVWRKTPVIPKTLSMEAIRLVQGEMITLAPTSSRRKLEEYLRGIKEEAQDEFDFDFKKFKYNEIFQAPVIPTPAKPITLSEAPSIISDKPYDFDKTLEALVPEALTSKQVSKPAITQVSIKIPTPSPVQTSTQKPSIPKPEVAKPGVQEIVLKTPQIQKPEALSRPETPAPITTPKTPEIFKKFIQPIRAMPSNIKEIIKPKPKAAPAIDVHEELRTKSSESPGRKFVSFSEREQEIVLPIRGERIIQVETQPQPLTGGKDIKTLTKELRTLVREIKTEETTKEALPTQTSTIETQSENNLQGICFDPNNNPLSNLMLALLDEQNRELQYTRTDSLGKFNFKNTGLANYKIKILNSEIYSLNFDIINVSVTKYPFTLIQIVGKK